MVGGDRDGYDGGDRNFAYFGEDGDTPFAEAIGKVSTRGGEENKWYGEDSADQDGGLLASQERDARSHQKNEDERLKGIFTESTLEDRERESPDTRERMRTRLNGDARCRHERV